MVVGCDIDVAVPSYSWAVGCGIVVAVPSYSLVVGCVIDVVVEVVVPHVSCSLLF